MKVTCPSCGAKYAIADDKVRGRRVKVRCKSCTTPIVVDGNALEADAAAATLASADDDEATRIAHSALPQASAEWSVNLSDTDQRSMSAEEIVAGWHSGLVRDDAFVWKEGMDDWKPVLEVPELASQFFERRPSSPAAAAVPAQAAPPWQQEQPSGNGAGTAGSFGFGAAAPVAAAAARPAAARVSGGRAHGREDLFSKAQQAGNEMDAVERQSAEPGASAYDEAKPTGARNENSVLFSLDALKAGFTPSAQAAPAPARGSSPKKSAPTASGGTSMDDLMNIGGASQNALFGFNANHALMHAPAPPEPPPPPPPSLAVPASFGSTISTPAPKSNKLLLAVAAAVAILLMVGVGLAVVISGNNKAEEIAQLEREKQELQEAEAKRQAAAEREREEAKKREAEAKKEESRPAESEADKTAAEIEAKKEAGKPITDEDRKRYAEAQKKKAEAAKTAEPAAKPEEPKREQSSGVASFNKGAAISALSSAASAASGCKRPDGPTGSGKALVTFAPSGNVTSATVSGGSFGGTSVGGCIASVFRRAKVPPFEGGPVTVSKSFSIAP
jgi:predicted Zn finger-like uncharacterized protein